RSHLPELPTPSRCHEILATPLQLASTPPRHRARCTHLQTQPGRIQPIDSSQLGVLGLILDPLFSMLPLTRAIGEVTWSANNEFLLVAIPLFIMLGEVLLRAGFAERMYAAMSL
ncbi:hypothetical protein AZ28_2252, partial [Bordetella pertussis B200]